MHMFTYYYILNTHFQVANDIYSGVKSRYGGNTLFFKVINTPQGRENIYVHNSA